MVTKQVIIYGGGGHAKVVKECLDSQNTQVLGFVDYNAEVKLFELKHLGMYNSKKDPSVSYVIAIGNNQVRKEVAPQLSHSFINAIHSSALISSSSKIGLGCMIFHQAIIQADSRIGNHVIINTAAQVDHDCLIEDFVHIGPGAILCGNVSIGEGTLVGAGSVVLPGIKIGKWVTIGAGSVVTKNVGDHSLVVGNPAKEMPK